MRKSGRVDRLAPTEVTVEAAYVAARTSRLSQAWAATGLGTRSD